MTTPLNSNLYYNILDFGAIPGADSANQQPTYDAFQRALAMNLDRPITIYVPPDRNPYTIPKPLIVNRSNVTFKGESGSVVQVASRDPVMILGFALSPQDVPFSTDHCVDITAKTDGSAGQRWGYRFKGDSHLTQCGGPLAQGPTGTPPAVPGYWADVTDLVIEIAYDTTDGGVQGGPFFGIDGLFWFFDQPQAELRFWTQDSPSKPNKLKFALPSTPGVVQIVIQLRLNQTNTGVAVNGLSVTPTFEWANPSLSHRQLVPAFGNPFSIGGVSPRANEKGDGPFPDRTILGYRIGNQPIYQFDSLWVPIKRLDGKAITWANTYYSTAPSGTFGYLPMQTTSDQIPQRLVPLRGQAMLSHMLFVSKEHNALASLANITIDNLTIRSTIDASQGRPYGDGIAICALLDGEFRNLNLNAGSSGIRSWNWGGMSYTHTFDNLEVQGGDCSLYLYNTIAHILGIKSGSARNIITCQFSRVSLARMFLLNGFDCERIFYSKGGSFFADLIDIDIEQNEGPSRCVLEAVSDPGPGGQMQECRLTRFNLNANLKQGVVLFNLSTASPTYPELRFDLSNLLLIGDVYKALVAVGGPNILGTIDLDAVLIKTPYILQTYTGPLNVRRVGPSAPIIPIVPIPPSP